MPDEPLDLAAALPPDLLDAAVAALGRSAADRDEATAALLADNPRHESALRQLFADFAGLERLLDEGYGVPAPMPVSFGSYRVISRLGDGAFGEVFLCEQHEPVCRKVAVKVLRAGVGDRTTNLRFAAERQLIASLQHPAIAQVFDAGTCEDGRPFFVMDAIDGVPIDRYCDDHALTVEARIDLFCDLCRGVHHAHERGIVHRDLKPANVLVVEVDGRPRPKVIDFGIAKLLHGSAVPRSFATEAGRIVGTPGYMSPEQQQGAADDVDRRADVFGLGVMLYELLCGQLPWAAGAAATDTDPQRPSTRVSTGAATATVIARQRSTEPRRLASHLRGELDWIVLECLQRDRDRRYQSAQELVEDLERHRRGEPVQARPPSTAYRLRKYVRRHRATAMVFAGILVLAGVAAVVAQQFHRSAAEIDDATARADARFADAAAAVARLLEAANDPNVREAPQGDAARETMLRDAVTFYDRFLQERPDDPGLAAKRCRALLGLSHVHWLLGDAPRATVCAQSAVRDGEALQRRDPADPEFHGLLGEALCRHGSARSLAGDAAGALASFTDAAEHLAAAAIARPARFGRQHAGALRGIAQATPRRASDERVRRLLAALEVLRGLRAVAPPIDGLADDFVLTSLQLGEDLWATNALTDAETALAEAEAWLPGVTAAERFRLAGDVSTLRARILRASRPQREALVHLEAALSAARAWQEAQPRRILPRLTVLRALRQLGHTLNYVGDFEASVACFREAIAVGEAVIGSTRAEDGTATDLVIVLDEFASTLYDRFRRDTLEEAAACIERAVILDAGRAGGPSERRWSLLSLQASIADARTEGGGGSIWPAVEASLPVGPIPAAAARDQLVGACAGLARWHLQHRRIEAASSLLERAEVLIASDPKFHAKRAVEIGWLQARLAAERGDRAAAAAAADRVLRARPSWYGRRRAADCLHLAWRCAGLDGSAGDVVAGHRQRALDLYRQVDAALDEDVAANPDDPWYTVPWGIARIRAAELLADGGDTATARELLATTLPRLEAVRADSHADQWDEQAFGAGRALLETLARAPR